MTRVEKHLPVREAYAGWAVVYDDDGNPLTALDSRELPRLMGEVRGLEVLDLGCGTGRVTLALADAGAKVTGIDATPEMLARAAVKAVGRNDIMLVEYDLSRPLPCKDESFDRVVCALVVEHIADFVGLLREAYRVVRPGGFVLVTEMHPAMRLKGRSAHYTDAATGIDIVPPTHARDVSHYVMDALTAGFQIDLLEEHRIDDALCAAAPRAAKYLGWPLMFVMRLRK